MKTRIISAAVLILVFLPFLFIGGLPFTVFVSILSVLGLHELLKVRESRKEFPFLLKIFAYLLTVYFCLYNTSSIEFSNYIDYRLIAFIIFLFLSPMVFINDTKRYNLNDALFLVGSVLFVGFSFNLIIITRNYDIIYIIYLLIITTITDTFALITGKMVGEHSLCSKISPNKTIEGLVGGVFMGTFVASAYYNTVINPHISLVMVIMITFVLCMVGQLGDLIFSSIKRYYGVKDFSELIPEHGGILDRFDSLVFVILAYVIIHSVF
jgi:phosphatidate cytidylyltransferase